MEDRIVNGFRLLRFPANPQPFLNAIIDHVKENGTASIKDDEVKAALLVVIQQAWGQIVTLDTVAEYERLNDLLPD